MASVLFTPVAILGLTFNSIGKLHIVSRIARNFTSLTAPGTNTLSCFSRIGI